MSTQPTDPKVKATPEENSLEDWYKKSITCLYLVVDSSVADDVKQRVGAYVCQLTRQLTQSNLDKERLVYVLRNLTIATRNIRNSRPSESPSKEEDKAMDEAQIWIDKSEELAAPKQPAASGDPETIALLDTKIKSSDGQGIDRAVQPAANGDGSSIACAKEIVGEKLSRFVTEWYVNEVYSIIEKHFPNTAAKADGMKNPYAGLVARITNYLSNGGFFNPEAMEHDKVRTLLMDCRESFNDVIFQDWFKPSKTTPLSENDVDKVLKWIEFQIKTGFSLRFAYKMLPPIFVISNQCEEYVGETLIDLYKAAMNQTKRSEDE